MRSTPLVISALAAFAAAPAGAQATRVLTTTYDVQRGGFQDDMQAGILLRFQLITTTDARTVDPAIAPIDAVLKDLFRYPGYRLLSQAAIVMERPAPAVANMRSGITMASQFLSGDGETYKLTVIIDSTTPQAVRVSVTLSTVPKPNGTTGNGITTFGSSTLFSTSVELSFGHTVVLGSTQPPGSVTPGGAPSQTLILAVRPELRRADGP